MTVDHHNARAFYVQLLAVSRTEIERLTRWKADAMAVLDQWERVFEMVPTGPGDLGQSKSDLVIREIGRLRGEIHRFENDHPEDGSGRAGPWANASDPMLDSYYDDPAFLGGAE